MNILFQIEYDRPSKNEIEDYSGDIISIETLSCMDLSIEENRKMAHALLDEFLNNYHHFPKSARLWFGGVCDHHHNRKEK